MKSLWLAPVFLVGCALAAENDDRIAIQRVLDGLNRRAGREALFTPDAEGIAELRGFERMGRETFVDADRPMSEVALPKVSAGTVRFITPDVAVADAEESQYGSVIVKRSLPLLVVLRRIGAEWRIAAIRPLRRSLVP